MNRRFIAKGLLVGLVLVGLVTGVGVVVAANWDFVAEYNDPTDNVQDVAFSDDGQYFAVASNDQNLYLYERSGAGLSLKSTYSDASGTTRDVDFSDDNQSLAYASADNNVYVKDISTGTTTATYTESNSDVYSVEYGDGYVAYGDNGNDIYVHDAGSGSLEYTLTDPNERVGGLDIKHGMLAAATGTNEAFLYNLNNNAALSNTFTQATNNVKDIQISPYNTTIAYSSIDGNVYVHDMGTYALDQTLQQSGGGVRDLSYSGDGAHIAYADDSSATVYVHDTSSWGTVATLDTPQDLILGVAFNPAGDQLAFSNYREQDIRVYEAAAVSTGGGGGGGGNVITGYVENGRGIALTNATVEIRGDNLSYDYTGVNASGGYKFTNLPNGTYEVTGDAPGYSPATVDNITVTGGEYQRIDVQITKGTPYDTTAWASSTVRPFDGDTIGRSGTTLEIAARDSLNIGSQTVTFHAGNGSVIGTDTINTNGSSSARTASVSWNSLNYGENEWYVRMGNAWYSQNWTFYTPAELYIRDEQTGELLDNTTSNVTVRFYDLAGEAGRVIQRSTANGTVNLTGLTMADQFVVDVNTTGYHGRPAIIRNIGVQQTVYLLNKSSDTVDIGIEVTDRTGEFPPGRSQIIIRKPIPDPVTGEIRYQTMYGDTLGTDSAVEVTLERGERYRVAIENAAGATRSLGTYQAELDGDVLGLEIGDISIEPPEAGEYEFDAEMVEMPSLESNNTVDEKNAIRILYRDNTNLTAQGASPRITLSICDENNNSRCIYGPETAFASALVDTVRIPPKYRDNVSQWNVSYSIEWFPTGETESGKVIVGDIDDLAPNVPGEILQMLSIAAIMLIAGLFGGRLSQLGAFVTVLVAAALRAVGLFSIPIEFLVAAFLVALLYLVGSDRREVRA